MHSGNFTTGSNFVSLPPGRIKVHRQAAEHLPSSGWPKLRGGEASWVPQRGAPYGTPRGRGGRYIAPHRNRTLILNSSGTHNPSATTDPGPVQAGTTIQGGDASGWVTRRDRHNQLINTTVFEQKIQERIKGMEETAQKKQLQRTTRQKEKVMKVFAAEQAPASSGYKKSAIPNHEVNVDNIRFRVTDGGSKLVRVDGKSEA